MGTLWTSLRERLAFSYGQKLFLLATVPLLLSVTVITWIVANQSRALADREIRALETQLIDAKRDELQNYISIARTAFVNIYGRAAPDDEQAKLEVTRILSAMLYGQDGYFFVFDYSLDIALEMSGLISGSPRYFITFMGLSKHSSTAALKRGFLATNSLISGSSNTFLALSMITLLVGGATFSALEPLFFNFLSLF